MTDLAGLLARGTILGDGATGTLLHTTGSPLARVVPALNLSAPELVADVHRGYVDAGSELIQTNTFGASRIRLAPFGHADQVEEINAAGVALARRSALAGGRPVLVAGSVSPAVSAEQRGSEQPDERRRALAEQVDALTGAGVDALVLETFGYLDELLEAIEVVAGRTAVPLIAQGTFGPRGRMLSGHAPRDLAHALADSPVSMIGINCTIGPQGTLGVISELAAHSGLPLSAQPNAGFPRRVNPDQLEYEVAPEYFARYTVRLAEAGATLLGGCCGTTPEHVAAAAAALTAHRAGADGSAPGPVVAGGRPQPAASPTPGWPGAKGAVNVEFVPTIEHGPEVVLSAARRLAEAGARRFTVAAQSEPGPRPSSLARSIEHAARLMEHFDSTAMASVTTANRTIMALQAHLLGAHARGVHTILAETGNPLLLADYPPTDGTWSVDSLGLIDLLAGLNKGVDHNGMPIGAGAGFVVGGRLNPGATDLVAEGERALAEVAAGARFLVTRPIFETDRLDVLLEALGGKVPVLATVRPLRAFAEAEFLRFESPEVAIPDTVLDRLEGAGDDAEAVGLDLARQTAAAIADRVHALVVRCNLTNTDAVAELVTDLSSRAPTTG